MKKKIYSLIIITTLMLMAQIATMSSAIQSTINADSAGFIEVCYLDYEWEEY